MLPLFFRFFVWMLELFRQCGIFCFSLYSTVGQYYNHPVELFVCFVCLMVFNTTFNNISVMSLRSVLLVEETAGPGENHRHVASHRQTLSHNVVYVALIEIRTHNIGDDRH